MTDEIQGYRQLSDLEIGAINDIKQIENRVGDLIAQLRDSESGVVLDGRWAAIAVTDLQKGFMALTRAVAKPDSRLK